MFFSNVIGSSQSIISSAAAAVMLEKNPRRRIHYGKEAYQLSRSPPSQAAAAPLGSEEELADPVETQATRISPVERNHLPRTRGRIRPAKGLNLNLAPRRPPPEISTRAIYAKIRDLIADRRRIMLGMFSGH